MFDVISHRFRTIFVHIPKTAGQSIEAAFLAAHGLDWAARGELLLRPNADRALGPQRLAHLYAREYFEHGHLSRPVFESYFSFAVVRNPYDRLLSEYRYRFGLGQDFESLLADFGRDDHLDVSRHMQPQAAYVLDAEGRMLVDEVVRFEDLAVRMPQILSERLGRRIQLPHVNSSDPRLRGIAIPQRFAERIEAMYRRDFELFGYRRA